MNQQEIHRLWEYLGHYLQDGTLDKRVSKARFTAAIQEATAQARRQALEEVLPWPAELTPVLREVLGKPNFWCASLAEVLRRNGQEIQHKSEDEQAAVLFWLAGLALKHGEGWKGAATAEVKAIRALMAQEAGK